MLCLSVSRSPHASARPSSVASISTRRACATSLKHSSPCPPRPTASPPPTSPLGCAFSANKAFFRTAPATLPTISKNSAANRSFSGSPALAGTTHSRPAFAQWPPSWCFATKPSNPCSLPLNLSAQLAARTTRDPSTPTTVSYRLPCTACDGRGREPTSILAEQRCQRLLEPACGDALEVEDRDQHLEAFRAACVRRQDRGAEGNALLARADPVTNARSAHRDRADAGHNLALGQVTVAHQPLTSIIGELVGVALEKPGHLRCDSLGQKRAGTAAQHLSQRVGQRTWLGKLENITVGHGVSLLQ